MPTDKARYTITVDDEMLDEIERYRYEHRLSSKNSATVELLRKGMEELNRRQEALSIKEAPTEEDAARAIWVIMHYQYDRPPTESEIELFGRILPVLVDGVKGK